MTAPLIASEIGQLRTVMVHRPGIEIARITPENKEALLFDDLLWLERAQEEHDIFAGMLRSRGAEVLLFENLLSDVLEDESVHHREREVVRHPFPTEERRQRGNVLLHPR